MTLAVALLIAAIWGLAAVFAGFRRRAAAVALNGVCAVLPLIAAAPRMRYIFDRDAYIQHFGTAALSELFQVYALLAVSVVIVAASVLTFRFRAWFFWIAWLLNAPSVVLMVYLTCCFKIF